MIMRLTSIVLIWLLLCAGFAYSEEVTRIIAKVNNEVITSRDLVEYCMALTYQNSSGVDESSCRNREFLAKILQRLIEDRLILAKARNEEFKIPDFWIEERFEQMVAAYPSREEFEKSLMQKGLTVTRVKEKIKEQFLMQGVIEKYVKAFVSVSPQEVSDYYNSNLDKFYFPMTYIFYMAKSEDHGTLEEISGIIAEAGIDGAKEKYTDVLFRIESGKDELKEEIFQMIGGIEEGGHVIGKSDGVSYLIYLEEIVEPKTLAIEDAKERIYAYLQEEKFRERFKEWIDGVKKNSVVKIYDE
jgi:hypothetical protein